MSRETPSLDYEQLAPARRRSIFASLWLGLLFAGTGLVLLWVVCIGVMWGILVADINPDWMPPLTGRQEDLVVQVTRSGMLAASLPPVLLSVAWAATAAVLLSRRHRAGNETPGQKAPETP